MGAEGSPESGPRTPSREEVLLALKSPEATFEEISRLFGEWQGAKQKEHDESGSEYSRLEYNLDVAELLVEAEMYDEAIEYYEAAAAIMDSEFRRAGDTIPEKLKALEKRFLSLGENNG